MKRILLPLSCVVLTCGNLTAQNADPFANHTPPDPAAPPRAATMISLLVEYIELDHTQVNALIGKFSGKRNVTEMRAALDELIDSEKARLLESAFTMSRSGHRTRSGSVEEFIYPTQFDPPEAPEVPEKRGSLPENALLKTPANPVGFEMRPVGVSMEFDCSNDGDSNIKIFGTCEWTHHLGEYQFVNGDSPHDESKTIRQPKFHLLRTYVTTVAKSGETILAATHRSKDDKTKRILVFVRADIVE